MKGPQGLNLFVPHSSSDCIVSIADHFDLMLRSCCYGLNRVWTLKQGQEMFLMSTKEKETNDELLAALGNSLTKERTKSARFKRLNFLQKINKSHKIPKGS